MDIQQCPRIILAMHRAIQRQQKNMTGADAVDMDRYNTFGNEEGNNQSSGQNVKAKDTQITFPQRLLQVLAERDSADAISWLSHGKSFIVYDKKKFVESILP